MTLHWTGQTLVVKKVTKDMERRMQRAVIFLEGEVKRSINRSNISGKFPSAPGEPPKKVTGGLFRSISHAVSVRRKEVVGYYGSNLPQAARLELGFFGIDSLGRRYSQFPRPYLRPAFANNRKRVARILGARR